MKKKTIIGIVFALIIIAGIAVTCTIGLNFNLKYSKHKEIDIYIGKEFENTEIKEISKEVIGTNEVIVQKVELYEDMVSIAVKDISDEQLANLNTKINEKYGIENKVEDITIEDVSNVRGRDLVKPYLKPVIISLVVIAIYLVIYLAIYSHLGRKISIVKTIAKFLGSVLGVEALYLSIIAIARLPVNELVIPVGIIIYAITTIVILCKLEKQYKNIEKKTK